MTESAVGHDAPARFRLLPLHLAREGFLALRFAAASRRWSEYSEHARRVAPRRSPVAGLRDVAATFERHPEQTGLLVFVAETLAGAFVVTHPEDYRKLHASLLEDSFGELLSTHAISHPPPIAARAAIDPSRVTSLATLDAEVARLRRSVAADTERLGGALFGRRVRVEAVGSVPPFRLERLTPAFDPSEECHVGERIVRDDGTLEYLKTFRLSRARTRRARLLEILAAANFHLDDAARLLECPPRELGTRMINAGLGYLLKPHVAEGPSEEASIR